MWDAVNHDRRRADPRPEWAAENPPRSWTYVVDGVVHYTVANMPGAVAKTSTLALTNATLPYALELANKGWRRACRENPEIRSGANVVQGRVTYGGAPYFNHLVSSSIQ